MLRWLREKKWRIRYWYLTRVLGVKPNPPLGLYSGDLSISVDLTEEDFIQVREKIIRGEI